VRKADNLPPFCAVVTKSGNLNFLELCGLVQACNGTALPLESKHSISATKICRSLPDDGRVDAETCSRDIMNDK